jgi:signal transduction histidine kinase/CheY-like chemotaxis protein
MACATLNDFPAPDGPEKALFRLFSPLPLPMMMQYTGPPKVRQYPNELWVSFVEGFVLEAGSIVPEALLDQETTQLQTWQMKSGEFRQIQLTWQPIAPEFMASDLSQQGYVFWLQDVTPVPDPEPVSPPAETTERSDLLQVNRLKDEFLACVSHELRSPLTALLGLSKLLQDPMMGTLSDRQRRYAQLIHRSGKQLISIVNDILDFTRMETGHLDLHPASVDLKYLCQQALEQVQHHSPDAIPDAPEQLGPSFTIAVEPGLKTLVADPNRLQQMLRHLFSNAFKFTPPEGAAGLRVSRWEGWVAFTVWDTGIGIPADKQHLIFQKFQQLENPMTRQFEGTGLGLVLTQRLARLHGGDVTFTSRPGKGSEFTLLLPPMPVVQAALMTESPLEVPARSAPIHPNRMVLVVESSLRNLEDLTEQLTELDYRVAIARSGTEALEKARRLQPCAILINPFLPMLSGWDVLTLLKSDAVTRHIPLVVTATRSEQQRAHSAGNGFLRIPISPRSLLLMLERVTAEKPPDVARPEDPIDAPARTLLCLYLQEPEFHPIEALPSLEVLTQESPTPILQAHNYRVIEAYDSEQAEMLARVWKPHAVILVGMQSRPSIFLKQIMQQTYLASLPIVTLDPEMSQAAQQVPGLAVFPCAHFSQTPTAVLQTVEVAIGFGGRPSVLLLDSAQWSQKTVETPSEWLQALMQYLQTAGLRGRIVRERKEMSQRLRSQGVDLLLVYWQDGTSPEALQAGLADLTDLETPPAVMILDYRTVQTELGTVAYPVIARPEDMTLVLQRIQQCLGI